MIFVMTPHPPPPSGNSLSVQGRGGGGGGGEREIYSLSHFVQPLIALDVCVCICVCIVLSFFYAHQKIFKDVYTCRIIIRIYYYFSSVDLVSCEC